MDSVIVIDIEPKEEELAAHSGTVIAKRGSHDGGCSEASGGAPACSDVRKAEKAGYEDGTSLKPIPKPPAGEEGTEAEGSEFASLFRKLVKTGMRLYTWPEAE